jgi:hypothetical protein
MPREPVRAAPASVPLPSPLPRSNSSLPVAGSGLHDQESVGPSSPPLLTVRQGDLADSVIALTDAAKKIKILQNASLEVPATRVLSLLISPQVSHNTASSLKYLAQRLHGEKATLQETLRSVETEVEAAKSRVQSTVSEISSESFVATVRPSSPLPPPLLRLSYRHRLSPQSPLRCHPSPCLYWRGPPLSLVPSLTPRSRAWTRRRRREHACRSPLR